MISSLAHISPEAVLGENVRVDPFASVGEDVRIGDGTHIMSGAVILPGTRLGSGCVVFPGAVIGAIPQDLKFHGETTTVEIGNNTTIRECVTVNRGTEDKWKTVIGNNCLLMAYAHVAHDCLLGNNVILANAVQLAGHVEVGDFAIIGGLSGAAQFIRIGEHTYVVGDSVINKDVPPFIKAGRTPLSYVGINSVGLQRRGYSAKTINDIQEVYRVFYHKGLNVSQALDYADSSLPEGAERDSILSFIRKSDKGIIKILHKEEGMKISLQNTGKRYNREWIFRRLSIDFLAGQTYAVTGTNGAGKSTLLQVAAGAVLHTEGSISYSLGGTQILPENAYRQISIAAPYLDTIEEMSGTEFLRFHASFKKLTDSIPAILQTVGLAAAADKQIRYYSSGMKQRLKLAQAFFSEGSALLLDEPLTNVDEEGVSVYNRLWETRTAGRLVIVSSNDAREYERCKEIIAIGDYK